MYRRVTPLLVLITLSTLACGRDSPLAPLAEGPGEDGLGEDGAVNAAATMLIQDMLSDPLFVTSLDDLTDPALAAVVHQSVDALASGDRARAGDLIATAHAIAQALGDEADASVETMILWSVLERYFETAGVL